MKFEERSGFQGLMTNVAESKAPPGALVEARNVVIRRPSSIEPRDGLVFEGSMLGSELWGFSYGQRDIILRDEAGTYQYRDLGAASPFDNSPQPFRRDILSRAEARGNLYVPGHSEVRRLLETSTAFERTGLPMTSKVNSGITIDGPIAPADVLGVTGFSTASYLENAANQGPAPAADYWIAVQFFLRAMPIPGVHEAFISRGKGVHPASTGYQLQMLGGRYYFSQYISGVAYPDTFVDIDPSHVGRMHLLVYAYTGGTGRLWIDGVGGAPSVHAVLPTDPTDVTTWGNGRMFGPAALQSAVLVNSARGTAPVFQADVDAIWAATQDFNRLVVPEDMLPTHYWNFSTIPPLAPIGGQGMALTGPGPAFQSVQTLWPGQDETYPGEFWLPAGYHVNYRLVGYEKDSSGLIRRSAPSAIFNVQYPADAAGSAAYVELQIVPTRTPPLTYSTVEIYRSRAFPIGNAIDDEMQLVGQVDANAVVTFIDNIPQESRGQTLYTSPSQGGAIQQNDPPPACAVVALFKGSLFFGNTRGPATQVLSFTPSNDGLEGVQSGIGRREYDVSATLGDPVLSMTNTVGLEPGMIASGPGFINALVTAVTSLSVTIDPPPDSTGTGTAVFEDRIWFGTTSVRPESTALQNFASSFPPDNPVTITQAIPALDAKALTFVLSSDLRAPVAAPFVIRATHGGEYSPPLPLYSEPDKPWDQDADPGRLMWSKPDEPEHVPTLNTAFVGDRKKAILGLVPTRDALYVLKEDGIWRLTGANASWRIDPFDPTTFCVLPNSIKPLHGRGCFLSRKGVVCVGDSGVELVSGPVNDLLRPIVDQILTQFASTGLYELDALRGSVAAVFERDNEYTLLLDWIKPALVFNQNTAAWTQFVRTGGAPFEVDLFHAIFNFGRTDRLIYALSSGGYSTALQSYVGLAAAYDRQYRADRELAVMITAYDPVTKVVTLPGLSMDVCPGDILIDDAGKVWIATGYNSGVTFPVASTFAGNVTLGMGILHRALRCRVVPACFVDPSSLQKHFRSLVTAFPTMVGGCNIKVGFQSSLDPNWVYEATRVYAPDGYVRMPMGYHNSALIPRSHARAWNVHGAVEWSHAFGNARLEAVYSEAQEILPDSPSENVP